MVSVVQKKLSIIVSNGAFGENVNLISFEQDKDLIGSDHYKSSVVFGTVTISDGSRYEIMVKLKLCANFTREQKHLCDEHFYNETIMYEKIIPFLLANYDSTDGNVVLPSIPRYFYGRNRCGEFAHNDLIILENVIPLGYSLSEERIILDYEHLLNALQTLAKFHALSYTAKHRDHVKFREIISDIHDSHPISVYKSSDNALFRFGKRGIDGLLRRNGLYREHEQTRRFDELLRNSKNSLQRALEPREPFSVVCHGDFNRNNVMFRHDEAGNPVDALLFDFGTPLYGSPALDLSFLLYMNTTQTVRQSRWDDLLDAYCSTLASSVPCGVRVPGRNELDSEMAASALYGLAVTCFFLPFQLEENVIWIGKSVDQIIEKVLQCGGEAGTERVADIVQHFIDMGYA